MTGMTRVLGSCGAIIGVLLVLLGAWGGLAPFIGPYFHYAYTPDSPWHFTLARLWAEILPAIVVAASGVIVMMSTRRLPTGAGAILAALAGSWFIAANPVSTMWAHLGTPGVPAGTSATQRALEELGFFTGLGAVIIFCAALELGRCTVADSAAGEQPLQ